MSSTGPTGPTGPTGTDPADPVIAALRNAIGPSSVLTDPDLTATYETDWTRRFHGTARAVARPTSTAEVASIIDVCRRTGAALVPQGGNTGLVGGGVPRGGEVVLSLSHLDGLEPIDERASQVSAGAGVTLARLQEHAGRAGLSFPVDLTARDAATIGGMIATNAGGLHVLRHGPMRTQVVGVEAVMADGTVVRRMSGLVKDNSGYDLAGLLCGSEGTLAVITEARLRLVARPAHRVTALVAVKSVDAALTVVGRLRRITSLEAVEVMFADGVQLVCEVSGLALPFGRAHPCILVVECAADQDPEPELAAALLDAPEVLDTAVAADTSGRDHLWSWRERHTEAVNRRGIPHKLDVTLPLAGIAAFEAEVRPAIDAVAPKATTVIWGHLGDGNLHVNIVGPAPDDERVDDAVLRLVAAHGGSISAEHGIGVAKRRWLGLTRSAADLAAMRAIKAALDPQGILNPGVLLPEAASE